MRYELSSTSENHVGRVLKLWETGGPGFDWRTALVSLEALTGTKEHPIWSSQNGAICLPVNPPIPYARILASSSVALGGRRVITSANKTLVKQTSTHEAPPRWLSYLLHVEACV